MACHQGHNIPWSLLADNLLYDPSLQQNDFTPSPGDVAQLPKYIGVVWKNLYFPRDEARMSIAKNQLSHFISKMASTIDQFAQTELTKWTTQKEKKEWPLSESAFNERMDQLTSSIDGTVYHLSHWQEGKGCPRKNSEVLALLMHKYELPALLTLSQSGNCKDLKWLLSLGYDKWNNYGVHSAVDTALWAYMNLNVLLAQESAINDPFRWNGQFMRSHCGDSYARGTYDGLPFSWYKEMVGEFKDVENMTAEKAREICSIYFRFIYTFVAFSKLCSWDFDVKIEIVDVLREFDFKTFRGQSILGDDCTTNHWSHYL